MDDPASDPILLATLADEFLERHRRGEAPAVEDYAHRFPALASRIRDLFPTILDMEGLRASASVHSGFVSAQEDPPLPESIAGFRILGVLGQGGMGTVYEAQEEGLDRPVALKVLARHIANSPQAVRRFEREAKIVARLQHASIVPLFQCGTTGGQPYYVMQRIRGIGWNRLVGLLRNPEGDGAARPVDKSNLPAWGRYVSEILQRPDALSETSSMPACPSRVDHPPHFDRIAAQVGAQVAGALAYAHSEGILHRDIKPSNLLLDVNGHAWVTDFGLAKAVHDDGLASAGKVIGTLRYMAPEQLEGFADERSDVYALGLCLYEILALRPAYGPGDQRLLMSRILRGETTPLREIWPDIPPALDAILDRATRTEPEERFASAEEMMEALHGYTDSGALRFLPDAHFSASSATVPRKSIRPTRRAITPTLIAAALCCVGLAGISGWYAMKQDSAKEPIPEASADTNPVTDPQTAPPPTPNRANQKPETAKVAGGTPAGEEVPANGTSLADNRSNKEEPTGDAAESNTARKRPPPPPQPWLPSLLGLPHPPPPREGGHPPPREGGFPPPRLGEHPPPPPGEGRPPPPGQ